MILELNRSILTQLSSIGKLKINGADFCVTLEPTDRGLDDSMTVEQIEAIKISCKTAIPKGTYKVIYAFSPKHNRKVPLLENVKGFEGIEMHIGNYPKDTEGCILCATTIRGVDNVGESTAACQKLWALFENAPANEPHTITIS